MMPPVSLPKIIVATIMLTLCLSGIYFCSLYYRLIHVNPRDFQICLSQDLREMQNCANYLMFDYLTDTSWLSIQFTLLVVPAAAIAYLFCRKGIARPITQSAIIAGLTIAGMALVMNQGTFAALVAGFGIMLGGLLARRRLDRVIVFNEKVQKK